jgi:transposase-like protein
MARRWSAEERAQATAWFCGGLTAAEIGRRLGRTTGAVHALISKADVVRPPTGLPQGTLVDPDVAEWASQYSWHLRAGYATRSTGKRSYVNLAREIMSPPDDMIVDHINGDPLDNRRSNLRVVSSAVNLQNRKALSTNVTGIRGVTYDPRSSKRPYVATAGLNGKVHRLGTFATADEAKSVVHKWRLKNMPGYVPSREVA